MRMYGYIWWVAARCKPGSGAWHPVRPAWRLLLILAGRGAWAQTAVRQAVEMAPGVWMAQGASAIGLPTHSDFVSNAGFGINGDCPVPPRHTMGEAARKLEPSDQACSRAAWWRLKHLPLFRLANRMNACNACLPMERAAP